MQPLSGPFSVIPSGAPSAALPLKRISDHLERLSTAARKRKPCPFTHWRMASVLTTFPAGLRARKAGLLALADVTAWPRPYDRAHGPHERPFGPEPPSSIP